MPSQNFVREQAHAKVNLTLKILGRRPDGYHELVSLVGFVNSPSDAVVLNIGEGTNVEVRGFFGNLIGSNNSVQYVLEDLARFEPRVRLGSVDLEKEIPVAAGLGGGSADAGALLRALRAANESQSCSIDWFAFAATLGADVPVCFRSRPAVVFGKGERVQLLKTVAALPLVLVNPMVEVPPDKTRCVYKALNASKLSSDPTKPDVPKGLSNADMLISYMMKVGNDLESAAQTLFPSIVEVKSAIAQQNGCAYAGLSGSGPTCFGVFQTTGQAEMAARVIRGAEPSWWVVATKLRT